MARYLVIHHAPGVTADVPTGDGAEDDPAEDVADTADAAVGPDASVGSVASAGSSTPRDPDPACARPMLPAMRRGYVRRPTHSPARNANRRQIPGGAIQASGSF